MTGWFSKNGMMLEPEEILEGKVCKSCGEFKSLDEFHKQKTGKNGIRSYCKKCAKEKRRERYEENPERDIEKNKKWRKNNPEKVREIDRRVIKSPKRKIVASEYQRKYTKTPAGKLSSAKHQAKRKRELGYVTLNEWFDGCEGHHIDKLYVIFIPGEMHRDNRHRLTNVKQMAVINGLAIGFLNEQRLKA